MPIKPEDSPAKIVRDLCGRLTVQHQAMLRMLDTVANLLEALERAKAKPDTEVHSGN